ncbi:MAG: hypothetical protein P4L53_03160 [Candidatus Obscuribacterales bacterium]|nr:hypothetical protein [Candidatus Obscuribacterales bacterium]
MTNSSSSDEKKVLQVIQDLGFKVTIADVVARTGLSIDVVSRLLASIAAKSASSLQVCDDGLVRYCFPVHLYYQFFGRGLGLILSKGAAAATELVSFLFKISFGLILLVSVVCIFVVAGICRTIFYAYANDFEGMRKMWVEFFSLFKWISSEQTIHLPDGQNSLQSGQDPTAKKSSGLNIRPFLMNCYLFLFGPGNPNADIETQRLQLIAQVIRLNEGIVLPEHLAPYAASQSDDDKGIFQILHKFGGYPTVLENSRIAYIFPSMAARSDVDNYVHVNALLEEREWQFTGLTWSQTNPVLMLAFSSILGAFLFIVLILSVKGTQLHHLGLFTFFAVYGCLFLFIPAVRFFVVKHLNRGVRKRNQVRRHYERLIGDPDEQLRASLEDVERIRGENRLSGGRQVIYRTDRDYLEQLTDI